MRPLEINSSNLYTLQRAASSAPDDYLIQAGYASLSLNTDSNMPTPRDGVILLKHLTSSFPSTPGAYALLSRALLQQGALSYSVPLIPSLPSRKIVLSADDSKSLFQLVRQAALIDRRNAYWPSIQAYIAFSDNHPKTGEAYLERAVHCKIWNSYLDDQVVGQWKLFQAAYGDNGVLQELEPLAALAFPHLLALRQMAAQAIMNANRFTENGHPKEAIKIRNNIAELGRLLRDNASWSYEALFGAELTLIAETDFPDLHSNPPVTIQEWEFQSRSYLKLLRKYHNPYQNIAETQAMDSLNVQRIIGGARSNAYYPGIPPGVPLEDYFANWMKGVVIIREMAFFALALLLFSLPLYRFNVAEWARWSLMILITLAVPGVISLLPETPTTGLGLFLIISVPVCLFGWMGIFNKQKETNSRFIWKDTALALILLFSLGLFILLLSLLNDTLARMNPVGSLLIELGGNLDRGGSIYALERSLLITAYPLFFILFAGLNGLRKSKCSYQSIRSALHSMVFPSFAALMLLYLGEMQITLHQEELIRSDLKQIVQNDRLWALQHTNSEPDDKDDNRDESNSSLHYKITLR